MTESLLWALFLAIVQMESGGRLNVINGDAVGPAQIKPVVVQDVTKWGGKVTLKDRTTLEGSYRIFKAYTDRWIAVRHLEDTPRNRANIWRHGPNSKVTLKGESTKYSLKVESLLSREGCKP